MRERGLGRRGDWVVWFTVFPFIPILVLVEVLVLVLRIGAWMGYWMGISPFDV